MCIISTRSKTHQPLRNLVSALNNSFVHEVCTKRNMIENGEYKNSELKLGFVGALEMNRYNHMLL